MKRLRCFWNDTRGYTSGISLILVVTILGLGAIAGLATVRDQLNQEFGDMAVGLRNLDQSFAAPCYGKFIDRHPPHGVDEDQPRQAPGGLQFEAVAERPRR